MNDQHQDIRNFKQRNKELLVAFVFLLNVFLLVLIISTAIGAYNNIKEGRYIGQEIETKNTITVSDTGEVYAKPDLALTTFSVVTEAKTVAEAMSENTKKMNAVIDFIKSQGIEDKDIKTTSFNIYPRYEWYEEAGTIIYPEGRRVLVGYEVNQSLEVKIRDMTKIGQIIEGATAKGANQVGDLQFTIDKKDELKAEARKQAIDKAKGKAGELASQLGVNLVRITNFAESSVVPFPRFYEAELKEGGLGGAETPQIETGENKITVTVTIVYEIN